MRLREHVCLYVADILFLPLFIVCRSQLQAHLSRPMSAPVVTCLYLLQLLMVRVSLGIDAASRYLDWRDQSSTIGLLITCLTASLFALIMPLETTLTTGAIVLLLTNTPLPSFAIGAAAKVCTKLARP